MRAAITAKGSARRRGLRAAVSGLTLLLIVSLALALGACGEQPADNGGNGGAPDRTGGILKVGSQPATNLDPHFQTSVADILLAHQVYDWLVEIDQGLGVQPGLATAWDSPDGKVWTFTLREGVTFHNGEPFTADDVVYSFDRMRDPDVGSPLVGLYSSIESIEATSPTEVVFTLKTANPEFPKDTGEYHAAIISKSVADPAKEWIGTGPFKIDSYLAEDRAILLKNAEYWVTDTDGVPLPYLDEVDFIFSPDIAGQVEALRGGELQFVGGISGELADTIKADDTLQLLTVASNMHYVIHLRSDEGHVASDPRVRQALKLATDHQGIIDIVRPGLARPGNGTSVGPAYGEYYLDQAPVYDVEQARQLLAEAGYTDGLQITLYAQDSLDVPAIATVWKEQMKQIGVEVDIQKVPADVYYGDGDASWLEVDFGITDWGTRATPVTYFKLAYTTGGDYNESHWSDAEFDTLTKQIDSEMDEAKRVELYKQAQQILIDRGPVIVPYVEEAAAGSAGTVEGIQLAPDWATTLLRGAYFTE